MSDYERALTGKLKLKKKTSLFKPSKIKKKAKLGQPDTDPDADLHGGWWRIADDCDLKGGINVSFECGNNSGSYLAAMDNGKFKLGEIHADRESPNPEEIFTLIKTPDDSRISMKTGYGKYVGVNTQGQLIAIAEAIGSRERFTVVFEDGESVRSNMFLSMKPDGEGFMFSASKKAGEDEMINLRTNAVKEGPVDWRSAEDKKSAKGCETSYMLFL